MAQLRKPFQGVLNIVRFNWHFYVIALTTFILLIFVKPLVPPETQSILMVLQLIILFLPLISLLVSWYVYDFSSFYRFNWLEQEELEYADTIVNINAGFDESTDELKDIFPDATIHVLDFYDPQVHTEVSIKRARNAYPAFPNTIQVQSTSLPLPNEAAENVFIIFAAHEIRNEKERILFLREVKRILKCDGVIVIAEHLRDKYNFMAFNIGFFHFYSRSSWARVFDSSGLSVYSEKKITPFVTIFMLKKK